MGLELSRQSPAWVRKGKISEMQFPRSPRKEKGMGNSISCWRERSQKKSEACGRVRNEGAMINPGKSRWGEWQMVGVDVRGLRDQRNSRRASAGSSDPNSNIT